MIRIKWFFRLVKDLIWFGIVNRSYGMSLAMLGLLLIGLLIIAAKISAPFIYTLF